MGTYPLQLLVGQADTVLHADLIADTTVLAKDGNALDLDTILDDAGRVAANRGRGTLNSSPGTNAATPANDGVENASVVLDLAVLEHDTLLDTGASANVSARANAYIGAELSSGVHFGCRVNEDGRDDVCARSGKLFAVVGLRSLLEVESVGRDSRASSLDLAPEVLGLVNVELLVVGHIREDILLQANNLALLFFVVIVIIRKDEAVFEVIGRGVGDETRGSVEAALDCGADRGEDCLGGEKVDTTVDQVADSRLGLLDIMQNTAGVRIGDNATEVCRRLVAHTCSEDDSLSILIVEKLEHLIKRERTANIGVENKETLGATLEDSIAEVVETASGSKCLILAEVLDSDGRELLGGVLDEVAEDRFVVVADDVNLLDLLVGDASDGGEAVPDDGMASDLEQRLGHV